MVKLSADSQRRSLLHTYMRALYSMMIHLDPKWLPSLRACSIHINITHRCRTIHVLTDRFMFRVLFGERVVTPVMKCFESSFV